MGSYSLVALPWNVSHFVVFRQTKRANSFELALSKRLVELAPASSGAQKVVEHMEEGYKSVVKSVQDADELYIGDTKFSKAQIHTISAKPDVVN